jgi:hypothetical protein
MYTFLGILLMLIAFALGIFGGYLKFKRTNAHGVEEFGSYTQVIRAKFVNAALVALILLLMFIAFGLLTYRGH